MDKNDKIKRILLCFPHLYTLDKWLVIHRRPTKAENCQTEVSCMAQTSHSHCAQTSCGSFARPRAKKGAGLSELWLPATRSGESEKGSENILQSKNSSEHVFNLIS